jgi:hypothetical protein
VSLVTSPSPESIELEFQILEKKLNISDLDFLTAKYIPRTMIHSQYFSA